MEGAPSASTVTEWQEALHSFGAVPLPLLEFWAQKQNRSSGLFGRSWSSRHFQLLLDGVLVWGKSEVQATESRHGISVEHADVQLTSVKGKQHCVDLHYENDEGHPAQLLLSLPDAPAASGMVAHLRVLQTLLRDARQQQEDVAQTDSQVQQWSDGVAHGGTAADELPQPLAQDPALVPPPLYNGVSPGDTAPRNLLQQFDRETDEQLQDANHRSDSLNDEEVYAYGADDDGGVVRGGGAASLDSDDSVGGVDDDGGVVRGGGAASLDSDEHHRAMRSDERTADGSQSAEAQSSSNTQALRHGSSLATSQRPGVERHSGDPVLHMPAGGDSTAPHMRPASPAGSHASSASFAQRLASIRSQESVPRADMFKKKSPHMAPPPTVAPPPLHAAAALAASGSTDSEETLTHLPDAAVACESGPPSPVSSGSLSVRSVSPVPLAPPARPVHGDDAADKDTPAGTTAPRAPAAQPGTPASSTAPRAPAAQGLAPGTPPWGLPIAELQLVKRQVAALSASLATFADEARGDLAQPSQALPTHTQPTQYTAAHSSAELTAALPRNTNDVFMSRSDTFTGGAAPPMRQQPQANHAAAAPPPPAVPVFAQPATHSQPQHATFTQTEWESSPLRRTHAVELTGRGLPARMAVGGAGGPPGGDSPPPPQLLTSWSASPQHDAIPSQPSISAVIHEHAGDLKFVFAWGLHWDIQRTRPAAGSPQGARCTLAALQQVLTECMVITQHQIQADAHLVPDGGRAQGGSVASAVAGAMALPQGSAPAGHIHSALRAIAQQVSADAVFDFQQAVTALLLVARWALTGAVHGPGHDMQQVQAEDGSHLHSMCQHYVAPWVRALRRTGRAWTSGGGGSPPSTPPREAGSTTPGAVNRKAAAETPLAETFARLPPVPPTPADASPFHSTWRSDGSHYIPPTPELPGRHADSSLRSTKIVHHDTHRGASSPWHDSAVEPAFASSDEEPWLCSQPDVFLLLGRNKAPLAVLFEHYSGGNRLMTPPALLRLLIDFDVVPALVRQGQVMDALLGVLADDAAVTGQGVPDTGTHDSLRSPLQARYAFQFHAGGAGAPAVRGVAAKLAGRGGTQSAGLYQDMYNATVGSGYADQDMLLAQHHLLELLPRLAVLAFATPSALARGGAAPAEGGGAADSLARLLRQMAGAHGGKRVIWQARGSHLPRFSVFGDARTAQSRGGPGDMPGGLDYLHGRSTGRGGRPRPNWR